jgi:hypothetical protein
MESRSERQRDLIRQLTVEENRSVQLANQKWLLLVSCRERCLYPARQIQAVFDAGILDTEWIVYRLTLIEQFKPLLARLMEIAENETNKAMEKKLTRVMKHKSAVLPEMELEPVAFSPAEEMTLRRLLTALKVSNGLIAQEVKELKKVEAEIERVTALLEEVAPK